MAYREDIRDRVRKQHPQALAILDLIDQKVREAGGPQSATVTLTGDMTHEEQLMAVIEGYLKDGYPLEQAEKKAKETLSFLDSF